MHRVVYGAKIPLRGRNQSHFTVPCRKIQTPSSQSLLLALCAHGLLSRAVMSQLCHSNTCWALLSVGSQAPALGG